MNCQSIQDQLTDYITGQLDNAERELFETHLNNCSECQAKLHELEAIWNDLGDLPQQVPSQLLRQRFYTMLEQEKDKHHSWQNRIQTILKGWIKLKPAPRLAAAFTIFLIGISLGYVIRDNRTRNNQLLQLGQEMQSVKQMMSIAMLQKKSSFDRMEGVSLSTEVDQPGEVLIQMLFSKINSDPSVPVRLAAIDAVVLLSHREDVQTLLTNSLMNQESPLVQIALIDQLIYLKEKNALAALKMLIENQETQPDVKTYAAEMLRGLI